jgi:hypothetical protein
MRRVCIAADGPVTMHRPLKRVPIRIFCPDGRKRSLNVCLRRLVGDALEIAYMHLMDPVQKKKEIE